MTPETPTGGSPDGKKRRELEIDANDRLLACEAQKALIDVDLREGYFFTAPQRARDVQSRNDVSTRSRTEDLNELQTSLGIELCSDFASEMLNTFMPSSAKWADLRAGIDLPEDDAEDILDEVAAINDAVFDAMRASNLYSAAAQSFKPDLALGTVAMHVDDIRPAEPVVCQPVPLRELEINVGPFGGIDDRFIVRWTSYRHLRAMVGKDVELPKAIERSIRSSPKSRVKVAWGWWRAWERMDDVVWHSVLMVADKVVASGDLIGSGSCPLLVGRFDPDPLFPFGQGPTLNSLPEFRRLDETEGLKIENADHQIAPAFGYPDDGIVNLKGGVEPRMGYPMRPGSGRDFVKLSFDGNPNFEQMTTDEIVERCRRLHFVDYARQVGKTPPTAQQWLDEMMIAQRRLGTPGMSFWREFPSEVHTRFRWLLEQRGKIQPVKVDGKALALTPYNPVEASQDQQDVLTATRLLELIRNVFPNLAQVTVDDLKTVKNLQGKMRDKIVEFRSEDQMKQVASEFGDILGSAATSQPLPGGGV